MQQHGGSVYQSGGYAGAEMFDTFKTIKRRCRIALVAKMRNCTCQQ